MFHRSTRPCWWRHTGNCSRSVWTARPRTDTFRFHLPLGRCAWQLLGMPVNECTDDWRPINEGVTPGCDAGWDTIASRTREASQMTADSARRPSSVTPAFSSLFREGSGYLNITCCHAQLHTDTHIITHADTRTHAHTHGLLGTLFWLTITCRTQSEAPVSTRIHGCLTGFYAQVQLSCKVRQHGESLLLFAHGFEWTAQENQAGD